MVTLRDKFRGCVAGSWIGSAMGAAVECWSREDIKARHGVLDRLLPYAHYAEDVKWDRLPGTTEEPDAKFGRNPDQDAEREDARWSHGRIVGSPGA